MFVVCSGFVSGQFSAFSAFTFLVFTGDCFPSQCFSVRFYPAPYVSRWSCLCGVKLPTVTSGTRLSVCRRIIVDGVNAGVRCLIVTVFGPRLAGATSFWLVNKCAVIVQSIATFYELII